MCTVSLLCIGCRGGNGLYSLFGAESGPNQLTDENAFRYLQKNRAEAPRSDLQAILSAIDHEKERAMGQPTSMSVSPDVLQVMRETIRSRQTINESHFFRDDFFRFGAGEEPVTNPGSFKQSCGWNLGEIGVPLRGDYLIPGVEKIPVRNQGQRGTCAAFAGIGMTEYAALNDTNGGNSELATLDLSEQRFYFDSKPHCQDGSCGVDDQGSWYSTGMEVSTESAEPNIPLEANCPYKNKLGENDVQAPLRSSCENGAVKLEEITNWCGIAELIELLHEGYAVPYASPLSRNWERNDGLITAKGNPEAGMTDHAGGHAYLIVGYRELPDMPEEGGICFMVKNSWGSGWGIKGYSCMTLAWMNQVTYDGFLARSQPVAIKVRLRADLAQTRVPVDDEAVDTNEDLPPDIDRDIAEEDKGEPDEIDLDPDEDETEEEVEPEPPLTWYEHKLLGPGNAYYQVECAVTETDVFIRGLMTGDREPSEVLRVKRQDSRLYFNGDEVGVFKMNEIRLCTAEFAPLCSLRYRDEDGLIYIQFRDDDLRVVKPEEHSTDRGEWFELDVAGGLFGLFVPNTEELGSLFFKPKTFIRLGDTTPIRLSLRPASDLGRFDIRIGGSAVGILDVLSPLEDSELCSGDFSNACNVLAGEQLHIIPRNSHRR